MKSRFLKPALIAAAVLAAAAAFIVFRTGRGPAAEETALPKSPSPTAVRVVSPEVRDMETVVSYIGTLYSQKEVRVIARVSGTVVELPLREGENAGLGTLLARIDAPEIRAQVQRLTVDRDYWARRHETDKRLVEKNALASEQADAGERSLKTTEAALAEAQSQLQKTRESAPFEGTVLSWYVEPGQSVLPGQPILLFGSRQAEVRVDAAEEDLRRGIRPGVTAEIEFESGKSLRIPAAEISPAAGGISRTFTVRIPLPDREVFNPRVGSSLRVNFILESQKQAVTVPSTAIVSKTSSPRVFIIQNDTAVSVPVSPGIESQGRIVVDFPWNGKDKVAVSNIGSLSDGTPVFAVDAEEAGK